MNRARRILLGGPASVLLVLLMLLGCLFLWAVMPIGWLWVGSQVQESSSLGTALAVIMAGVVVTILVVAPILAWLNRKHVELREARDLPVGETTALEVLMVLTAGIAVVAFGLWFVAFSGTSPIPVNLGY